MRIYKNECQGNGPTTVSSHEAMRGFVSCSSCGKSLKIRANRENEAYIPRHSRLEPKTKGSK